MKDENSLVTSLWKTKQNYGKRTLRPSWTKDILERDEDLLVNLYPPLAIEVKSGIATMKSGKAPRADIWRIKVQKCCKREDT